MRENKILDEKKSMFSVLEVVCTVGCICMFIAKKHSTVDFFIPVLFSVVCLCSVLHAGMFSRLLSGHLFQIIGRFSFSLFLTQAFVIFLFCAYFPQLATNRIYGTLLYIVVQAGVTWIFYELIEKKRYVRMIQKIRTEKYSILFIFCILVAIVYLKQGTNIWAETVAEYQQYAEGNALTKSFGGYITLFPILIGYFYHYLISWSSVSWYTFCTFASFIYTLLCMTILYLILRRKEISKTYISLIFLTVCIMLVHPSVSTIINITHLGYIPIIVYFILSVFDRTITEGVQAVPTITVIPLLIAVLSKPSFFFLTFLVVIFFTKSYKRLPMLLVLIFTCGMSCYQILLYAGTGSAGFKLGGLWGIIKFILTFIEAVGSGLLFPVIYYLDGTVSDSIIFLSIFFGIFLVSSLLYFWWKNRFSYSALVGMVLLFSVLAATVMPYVVLDYTQPLYDLAHRCAGLCFSKYKLQYQMTSSTILVTVFLMVINRYCLREKETTVIVQGVSIVTAIALLNGLFSGIYSAHWQTVRKVENSKMEYLNEQPFIYAPYPDWDFSWSDSIGGWIKGNAYKGYLKKPAEAGGEFREKNEQMLPEINEKNAKIYLMLSDPKVTKKNPTDYMAYFYQPDTTCIYVINDNSILFSESTDNAIRYAVVDYSKDFAELLYSERYSIQKLNQGDGEAIQAGHLNYIIVW